MADRKRMVRCLLREVVLVRDDRGRASGGSTLVRLGWCTGAWSELRVRRPSSGELARTPARVLERLRTLAQQHPDDRVAALLNAAGLRTRQGLPWTYARVGEVRRRHRIPTACPIVPHGDGPRGDGLVAVGVLAAQVGVTRSTIGRWCRCGLLGAEQKAALDPRWIRLTTADLLRLDGTLAAQGHGRWRIRAARRWLGLSEAELYQRVRDGRLVAYRARVGEHWEWRVGPSDEQPSGPRTQPISAHAQGKERH